MDIAAFLELFNVRLERRLNVNYLNMFQNPPAVINKYLYRKRFDKKALGHFIFLKQPVLP